MRGSRARPARPAPQEAGRGGRAPLRQPGAAPSGWEAGYCHDGLPPPPGTGRRALPARAAAPPYPRQLGTQLNEDPPAFPLAWLRYIRAPPPAALSQAHPLVPSAEMSDKSSKHGNLSLFH